MSGERDTARESHLGIEAEIERAIRSSRSQHRHYWATFWKMPALQHWPDRTHSFEPERSEVFAYIVRECGLDLACGEGYRPVQRIFDAAKDRGVIRFDPETLLWRGMLPPWERYRRPSTRLAIRKRQIREAKARAAKIEICERCGEWLASRDALWNHIANACPAGLGIAPAAKEDADA